MKKTIKIVLCLAMIFAFTSTIKAVCNNEDLNEWATRVQVDFIEIKDSGLNSSEFAYLLGVTPTRDDITLVVTDGKGDSAESKVYQKSSTETVIAVGCYTNTEEETYTVKVYGAEGSKCAKELLKTMKYTVPRYNRYVKDSKCQNNNSEYCKTFSNSTKGMDSNQFAKALKGQGGSGEGGSIIKKIVSAILSYGLYVIIPLALVSVFYFVKIGKFKREERNR